MATLDERVRVLEVSMTEQGAHIIGLRADVAHLRTDVADLRTDMRALRTDVGALRDDMGRKFTWFVGIYFIGVLTIVAAFLGFR